MTMPRPVAGERVAAEFGFVLREPEAPPAGAAAAPDGAPAVTFVARGSAAEKAGLAVGDVIVQVNDQSVLTRDAAREALGELEPRAAAAADRPARGGAGEPDAAGPGEPAETLTSPHHVT